MFFRRFVHTAAALDPERLSQEVLRFSSLLNQPRSVAECRRLHQEILSLQPPGYGAQVEVRLLEKLAQMYLDCEGFSDAWSAFQRLRNPAALLCTNMVTAFAENGDTKLAFHLFRTMQLHGIPSTPYLVVPLLKLCTNVNLLPQGKMLHACITDKRLDKEIFVGNMLITMYAKCGTLQAATDCFWSMAERNQISWNAILTAYAEDGDREEALFYFHRMQLEGVLPNKVTFLAVLNVFIGKEALRHAKKIHQLISTTGYIVEHRISNAIVNVYSKTGGLKYAREAFDRARQRDIITWTTMFDAYSESGDFVDAFQLFRQMLREGEKPNQVTFTALLKGCSCLKEARFLHMVIAECGYESNSVIGTNLIKMYASCGSPGNAKIVFDKVAIRDTVLWTALITAYTEQNLLQEVVQMFMEMQREGFVPDEVTYTTVLDVCAKTAAVAEGKQVHTSIVKSGIKLDLALQNAILNMYGRCGKMEDARNFFSSISQPDILSWTIHIAAHAHHGYGREALELLQEMLQAGLEPDYCTFVNILSACRHAGLVREGCDIFHRMVVDCRIPAKGEQYNCMIDLLGRAGQLDIAEEVLRNMPFQPESVIWKSFLSACRAQGDVNRAKYAAAKLLEIAPDETTAFVVLSNVLKGAQDGLT